MKNIFFLFLLFSVNATASIYELPANAIYKCENGAKLKVSTNSNIISVYSDGKVIELGLEFGSMGDSGWDADFTMYDVDHNDRTGITRQAFIWGKEKKGQQLYDNLTVYSPYYDNAFSLETECTKVK